VKITDLNGIPGFGGWCEERITGCNSDTTRVVWACAAVRLLYPLTV